MYYLPPFVALLDTVDGRQIKAQMQYTGLKDKNGLQEVYEGDVIQEPDGDTFVVEWGQFGCDYHGGMGYPLNDPDGDRAPENIEVIGNIWENPELKDK